MPKRKSRIIKFSRKKQDKITPWLNAQDNCSMSVYMLIRLAQHLYGNRNWVDIAQSLADKSVLEKLGEKVGYRPVTKATVQTKKPTGQSHKNQTRPKAKTDSKKVVKNDRPKPLSKKQKTESDKSSSPAYKKVSMTEIKSLM